MKATKTAETEKAKIEVTLARDVTDETAYLDGWDLPTGERKAVEIWDVKVTILESGHVMWTTGKPGDGQLLKQEQTKYGTAYKMSTNNYIGPAIYAVVQSLMAALDAEMPKTDEQIALEAAEAKRIAAKTAAFRPAEQEPAHGVNGYCRKCHSYCYGDCGA
jgi:hypothetical protein